MILSAFLTKNICTDQTESFDKHLFLLSQSLFLGFPHLNVVQLKTRRQLVLVNSLNAYQSLISLLELLKRILALVFLGKEEAASKYLMFAELVELALICLISLSVFLLTFLSEFKQQVGLIHHQELWIDFFALPFESITEFIKA